MNKINTGGPGQLLETIDLRDFFAAKALPISYQFWMNDYYHPDASDAEIRAEDGRGNLSDVITLIAETAYEMADAMMEARKL
jgi:hypothetical protein